MSKKSVVIVVILVIISIIIGLIGGYYLSKLEPDKAKKEEKATQPPTLEVKKDKVWTKEEISSYMLPIMEFAKTKEAYYPNKISDEDIFITCFRLLYNKDIKKEIDETKVKTLKKENETGFALGENIRTLAKRYFNRDNFQIDKAMDFTYDAKRDVYFTTSTSGWTGGGELAFRVVDLKQTGELVTTTIDGYYTLENYDNSIKDTTYQALLNCNNESCYLKSIIKQ